MAFLVGGAEQLRKPSIIRHFNNRFHWKFLFQCQLIWIHLSMSEKSHWPRAFFHAEITRYEPLISHDISAYKQLTSLVIIDKVKSMRWVIVLQPYSMVALWVSILGWEQLICSLLRLLCILVTHLPIFIFFLICSLSCAAWWFLGSTFSMASVYFKAFSYSFKKEKSLCVWAYVCQYLQRKAYIK